VRLIGVGMGPGDPELVTVKAVRVLQSAQRVFVPVLGEPGGEPSGAPGGRPGGEPGGAPGGAPGGGPGRGGTEPGRAEATVRAHACHDRIERLVFALNERTDRARREQHWDAAGRRVAEFLAGAPGATVAFATIGDPNLYSTFSYLAQTVRDLVPGLRVETVPGITAMQELAARSGIALAEGTEPLALLPMTDGLAPLATALAGSGNVVAYKGRRRLTEIVAAVRDAGRLDGAVYGAHLGLAGEQIVPLADADPGTAPYLSALLVPARRGRRGGAL